MNNTINNPLLVDLPDFSDMNDLINRLRFYPVDHKKIKKADITNKYQLLVSAATPFEPTEESLKTAMTVIGMIRSSYESRNPMIAENKRSRMVFIGGAFESVNDLPKKSFGQVSALVVTGITGMGKTLMMHQILSMLPEVLNHEANQETGWLKLSQIIYIYIEMPGEGSRGGLIHAILSAFDRLLGGTYAIDYPKKYRTVDKLEVETIRLLHVYFTGILIIDEIQVRNIIESAQSKVMQLFLLSIINAGIPVILMGNPLGFKWINKFSQDVRRLYSIAPVILDPYPSPLGDDEWKTIYRGIKSYYVLEKYPKNDDKMCHLLWAVSGGIPGIAMTIWRAAQRIRLFDSEGGELQEQDLSDAFNLEGFDELRMIANGFSTQNPIILKHFSDIPWREYGKKWGKSDGYDEITSDESEIYIEKMSTKRKRISERSKLKAKNTREKNKQKKRDQVKTQLTNDDLRNQSSGLQAVLLDGLMDTIDIDEKA